MPNKLAAALTWYNAGALPIPVRTDGSKAPGVRAWRDWQHIRPDVGVVVDLFSQTDTDGVGIICGEPSGNLEMIELEGRAVTEGYLQRLAEAFDAHGPEWRAVWDRIAAGYCEQTPSGGLHWYYRISDGPAAGNTKLASRPRRDGDPGTARQLVLIETRGQGGFSVVAPSGGRTHPTGLPWQVLTGSPATIPALTSAERDGIHAIANTLDEVPAREWAGAEAATAPTDDDPDRPGQDFNTRGTWRFLADAGWTIAQRWPNGRTGWARPGKDPRAGISATTDGAADGVARLYVFSSSTEFTPEQPYTRFGAYAWLLHGGDFAAAARALRAAGYGGDAQRPALTMIQGGADGDNPAPPTPAGFDITPDATTPAAAVDGTAALAIDADDDPPPLPHIIATSLTDAGNGALLAARHSHRLRWVPTHGHWIVWDGRRWRPCEDRGEALQAAQDTIRAIPPSDDDVRKHKLKSLSRRALDAMVDLGATTPTMRVRAEQLDAAPMVLNTPGGLVDLVDGSIRPCTPADLCTKITTCTPDPDAPAPVWETFLTDTFGGDQEMIDYVQRLAGYSAWGHVTHHVLPFLHGPGGNGKSVFVDVLVDLLGDYASTAPPSFLLAGRDDESAIARLAGLRLVVSSEVNQGSRFDEAKVKLLTGGDTLTARFLYGRHFTFRPSHTLWVAGNHQPRVEAGGNSFWRRLRLIPFTQTVAADKRNEHLKTDLIENEGPAIMAWIIKGALDVAAGLREPDTVQAATTAYSTEEDALGRFVDERLMLTGAGRCRASELRAAYAAWCRAEGEQAVSNQVLARELRDRWGIEATRSHGSRYYVGCDVYADPDDDETPAPTPAPATEQGWLA